jgi:hypothetical protein
MRLLALALTALALSLPALGADLDPNDIDACWDVMHGTWEKEKDGGIRAIGNSRALFRPKLPCDCKLVVEFTPVDGLRPRIHFYGDRGGKGPNFHLGNENTRNEMWVHGPGATEIKGKPFLYKCGQKYRVEFRFEGDNFSITFDGKDEISGRRKAFKCVELALSGGDGWSAGTTCYKLECLTLTGDRLVIGLDAPDAGNGNNGVGNGQDPQPPGNPKPNDGPGAGPGNPGSKREASARPFEPRDGKLYVQSEPAGATILVEVEQELRDTGKKTPAMVNPAKGKALVVVRMDKYHDGRAEAEIGEGIAKTGIIKMDAEKINVDILFIEDGWRVYVDGNPTNDMGGKNALTPCTISMSLGEREITLSKNGFVDITQKIIISKNMYEITGKITKSKQKPTIVAATIDFDKLTEEQWKTIDGIEKVIMANEKETHTGIDILDGQEFIIIPNNKDKWSDSGKPCNYKGKITSKDVIWMNLCYKIGDGNKLQVSNESVKGQGKLFLLPNDGMTQDNYGFIRIKIVRTK